LNLNVRELTGDEHLTYLEFKNSTIIVCTPEKWDVISRKSIEKAHIDSVHLMIVDEIHMLND
jgi:replicative superfamily II helicase